MFGGAAAGAINAELTGGDPGMGALIGAVTTAISFGIGYYADAAVLQGIDNSWAREAAGFGISSASGGITGGVAAEMSGGDFWSGFAQGAASAAGGYIGGHIAGAIVKAASTERAELPIEMQEAGISIDPSFPTSRHNQIVEGLTVLFGTAVGRQMLGDIRKHGGLKIIVGDELHAGDFTFEVHAHPRGFFGTGPAQFLRGLRFPANEFRALLLSGVKASKMFALNLGHEMGHAIYGYSDWRYGAPNLHRIENPLRTQLGISTMRTHYMGTRIIP